MVPDVCVGTVQSQESPLLLVVKFSFICLAFFQPQKHCRNILDVVNDFVSFTVIMHVVLL